METPGRIISTSSKQPAAVSRRWNSQSLTVFGAAQSVFMKRYLHRRDIPPEQYNQELALKPSDYSDVGQAIVLAREYEGKLRYSPSTDFLVYNGRFWEESKPRAQAVAQELTTRQLEEAETEIRKTTDEIVKNGAWDLLASMGPKKAAMAFSPEQTRSFQKYENAAAYRNYAIKRRDSKYISAALKESRPMVEIDQRNLDADEFLLNTPSATYDLRTGISSAHDHVPEDFITKQTSTPSVTVAITTIPKRDCITSKADTMTRRLKGLLMVINCFALQNNSGSTCMLIVIIIPL